MEITAKLNELCDCDFSAIETSRFNNEIRVVISNTSVKTRAVEQKMSFFNKAFFPPDTDFECIS